MGKRGSRRGRQPTRQPTAEDSTITQDQTAQSETTSMPQPQPTRSPQPAQPAEQQQPTRTGPVTRSSRLAPIEKQPGRTFSREEARKRGSSLSAPPKGRKRTRKTEAQLLALSTQEVGLGEALQVASVTLQGPTNPPSEAEATAGDRTQVEISCDEIVEDLNNTVLDSFSDGTDDSSMMEQQPTETAPNTRPPQSPANSCCGSDSAPDCERHPEEWDRYHQERRERLPPVEYAQEVVGVIQEHVDTLKYFEQKNEERRSQQNASRNSRSPGTSKGAPKLETSKTSSGSGSGSGKKRKQSLFKIPKEPETALETSRCTEGTDPDLEDPTPAFVPAHCRRYRRPHTR